MITSISGPPQETILLKNIDSKMIQKNSNQLRNQFQQVCLQLAGKIFICV